MMTDKENKTPDFNSSNSSTGERLCLQTLVNRWLADSLRPLSYKDELSARKILRDRRKSGKLILHKLSLQM